MGKRGPQPKPTALRLLHGDRKDRVNHAEPVPSTGEVTAPAWLGEEALAVWRAYAPDLKAKGVLTSWDVEAFAALCDAVARRAKAVAALATEGEVVQTPILSKQGELVGYRHARNPWVLVLNASDGQVQRWGARFGMTPSERAQLKVGGAREPQDDLLTGG